MYFETNTLKELLSIRRMDSSDFILIGLQIIKNERISLTDPSILDKLIDDISIDYLSLNYESAIRTLIKAATILGNKNLIVVFEQAVQHLSRNDHPEGAESRRYFETKYSQAQWSELGTEACRDSFDRLAKYMSGANLVYSEGKDYRKLRKVSNLEDIETVVAALRAYAENTTPVIHTEVALRNQAGALASFKDKGKKRSNEDAGLTMNPGIVKANTPTPRDDLTETAAAARGADSFSINREIIGGYSASNVIVPYVNSVSGTAYSVASLLHHYIEQNKDSPTLQQDIENAIHGFILFTCKSGYHSLAEMLDVFSSKEITDLFEGHQLQVNFPISRELLDKAIEQSKDYVVIRRTQQKTLLSVSLHRLFKRHAELRPAFPIELHEYVSEKKQSGIRVANALENFYTKCRNKGLKYHEEYCIKIARQYLDYALKKHPNANVKGVKAFIKKMEAQIERRLNEEKNPKLKNFGN